MENLVHRGARLGGVAIRRARYAARLVRLESQIERSESMPGFDVGSANWELGPGQTR